MVGIRYGNGFFILLEVAGFRGCTIIGGVRNRQCVGDVGAFAVENTQIKLVHSLNCLFAHSCFVVLHTKMLPLCVQLATFIAIIETHV